MKNIMFVILISVAFFALGYLYSSKSILFTEFVESNSNILARTFLERSSVYLMLRQEKEGKAEKVIESLIVGDLVAMEAIDFSDTSNAEFFCSRLVELKSFVSEGVVFTDELEKLIKKCP